MLHCNINAGNGVYSAWAQFINQSKENHMNINFEQFTTTSKANLQALESLNSQNFAGIKKLFELNLATSKAILGESLSHIQSVMGAKDAQEVLALHSGLLQPLADKSAAYFQHVQTIATGNGAEFTNPHISRFLVSCRNLGD